MPRVAVLAAVLSALLIPAGASRANQPASCFKRPDLIRYLAANFKESPIAVGLTDAGMLLEVFSSLTGETWTVAVTTPAGMTCLMATGQDWQAVPRTAEVGPPA
ncbi:MAG: hypothetical protein JNK67_19855 [Alphaproteobacteria bacterium]|nr:hypothetical protein [Alphaproteobacteria bacterium]